MFSTKLSVSIHILSVIACMEGKSLTSEFIAGSIGTNPVLVRRLMGRLKKADLLVTKTKVGVIGIGRDLDKITLLDIFLAVEDDCEVFGIHTSANPACPIGAEIETVLTFFYQDLEASFYKKLSETTLSDITNRLYKPSFKTGEFPVQTIGKEII